MIENKLRFFFRHQIWHLGGTILLLYIGSQMVDLDGNKNTFLGISSLNWFMIAMSVPLIHQAYVWICWRSELCWKSITNTIGFKGYVIVFFIIAIYYFVKFEKSLKFPNIMISPKTRTDGRTDGQPPHFQPHIKSGF